MTLLKKLSLLLIVCTSAVFAEHVKSIEDSPRLLTGQDVRLLFKPSNFLKKKASTPAPKRSTIVVQRYPHYPYYKPYGHGHHPLYSTYPAHRPRPIYPIHRPTRPTKPHTHNPHHYPHKPHPLAHIWPYVGSYLWYYPPAQLQPQHRPPNVTVVSTPDNNENTIGNGENIENNDNNGDGDNNGDKNGNEETNNGANNEGNNGTEGPNNTYNRPPHNVNYPVYFPPPPSPPTPPPSPPYCGSPYFTPVKPLGHNCYRICINNGYGNNCNHYICPPCTGAIYYPLLLQPQSAHLIFENVISNNRYDNNTNNGYPPLPQQPYVMSAETLASSKDSKAVGKDQHEDHDYNDSLDEYL